ncbi:MAG: class I SAM-dependent methyltransferase [Chloroflexota bacterium]|nr:class I SAM-dependent methyltransferase [Chloroflexota bacterium]
MEYPGLDDAFLHYIRATPESLRRIHSFYVPFFTGCSDLVVDLACGHGDFVQMLAEHNVKALGVDSDPACCAEVQRRGINVVCDDVIAYLQQVEEDSLAGIFSSHLVEHLPYQQAMELIRLSYRALKPGGIILLTTPNVRGLYPHLESFYMHFGHVTFYHPRLLGFFLDYFGFSDPRAGENPRMAHPLWRDFTWPDLGGLVTEDDLDLGDDIARLAHLRPVRYDPLLPAQYPGILGQMVSRIKMFVVRLVVQPLLDRVVNSVNQSLRQLNANVNATHQQLMELDRAVECYVYANKGEMVLDLPELVVGERL